MTETPSEQPHPQPQTPIAASVDPTSLEYWCYICDKVVPGETHADHPGIVCQECEGWYIDFIGSPPPLPTSLASYSMDQRRFGKHFLQALRVFSRLVPAEDPPQNQPPSAMQIAGFFGQHCLYLLRFSSQVGDRGVVAPPNQQFLFDVGDLRSRSPPSLGFNPIDELRAGEQFLRMLRLISQGARDDVVSPDPPSPHCVPPLYSFLREERTFGRRFLRMLCLITQIARDEVDSPNQPLTDSWDLVEQIIELYEPENLIDDTNEADSLRQEEEDDDEIEGEEDGGGDENEIYIRNERRIGGNLARLNRERWANIEAGIEVPDRDEDQSANFRGGYDDDEGEDGYEIQDETGGYVGNPGDYLDAADYETLLQILAESVGGGRPGAPPASKGVVEALETLKIKGEGETLACAICQDTVNIGETAKKLPCGHGYHGDCIVPWLGSRNSCPLCRYELPTDYPDYEEERKKRAVTAVDAESSSRGTRGDGDESEIDTEDQEPTSYFDTDLV